MVVGELWGCASTCRCQDKELKGLSAFLLLVIRPMGLGLRLRFPCRKPQNLGFRFRLSLRLRPILCIWNFQSDQCDAIAQTDKRKWFCAVDCECVHQHADARTRPRPQGSQSVSLLVRSWPIRPKAQIQCHSVAQHESRIIWSQYSCMCWDAWLEVWKIDHRLTWHGHQVTDKLWWCKDICTFVYQTEIWLLLDKLDVAQRLTLELWHGKTMNLTTCSTPDDKS